MAKITVCDITGKQYDPEATQEARRYGLIDKTTGKEMDICPGLYEKLSHVILKNIPVFQAREVEITISKKSKEKKKYQKVEKRKNAISDNQWEKIHNAVEKGMSKAKAFVKVLGYATGGAYKTYEEYCRKRNKGHIVAPTSKPNNQAPKDVVPKEPILCPMCSTNAVPKKGEMCSECEKLMERKQVSLKDAKFRCVKCYNEPVAKKGDKCDVCKKWEEAGINDE